MRRLPTVARWVFNTPIIIAIIILVFATILFENERGHSQVPNLREGVALAGFSAGARDMLREMFCLALNDYHEARGESVAGRIAVANVVENRVRDPRYPDTICGVVIQPNQFSWVDDRLPDIPDLSKPEEMEAWDNSLTFAEWVTAGRRRPRVACAKTALWYHAVSVRPVWAKNLHRTCRIGDHLFYAEEMPPKPRRKPASPEPGSPDIEKEEIMLASGAS